MTLKAAIQTLQSIDWGNAPACNPHLSRLYPAAREWLTRIGLTSTDKALIRHEAMDIPYLAALTYPDATEEGLLIAHNWMSWLFVYDDTLDEGLDGLNPGKIEQNRENFLKIFRGDSADLSTPLSIALEDIWHQISSLSNRAWQHRFFNSAKLYLNAVEWEAQNRIRQSFPSKKEYIRVRMETSGAQTCFDLLIPTSSMDLKSTNWRDEKISRLEILANEIIVLSNDIISFPKEQANNDLHNFVLIQAEMQECEPADVLPEVSQLVSRRVSEFRDVALEIYQGSHSDDRAKYVKALETWYIGNCIWSLKCGRYRQLGVTTRK